MYRAVPFILAIAMLATGCAHHRLKVNTSKQACTIADIQEQQVLDNIAMFVANSGSTPYFALPSSGGTTVGQKNSALGDLDWNSTRFIGAKASAGGELSLQENWTLKPINEPERLDLMKCLYQRVTNQDQGVECQDCEHKLTNFFRHEIESCPIPQCLFEVRDSRPPRRSKCHIKYGCYQGTYVWVRPEHFEDLSRLTIAVLDIATITTSDLAKRITRQKKVSKVQLTESYIAKIDGKPRLIQASYALSDEDYRKLQSKGAIEPRSIAKLLTAPENTDNLPLEPGIKSEELNLLPAATEESSGKDRRETGNSIESLLHINNATSR